MIKSLTILTIIFFNLSNAQGSMEDLVISKKWIVDNEEVISPWSAKIMPTILNFNDNKLFTNFSNHGYKYSISGNIILINDVKRFVIINLSEYEIVLSDVNSEEVRRYVPVMKGLYGEIDLNCIQQNLINGKWSLNEKIIQFDGSFSLKCYTSSGDFLTAGIYLMILYNGQIFLVMQFDGNLQKEIYSINLKNDNCFVLRDIKTNVFYMCR